MSEQTNPPACEPAGRGAAFLRGFLDGYREAAAASSWGPPPDPAAPPAVAVPATRPDPTAGILDRIDDAITGRCACGCGQTLTDRSPSGFYATADCQTVWMRQHATDPDDVYGRPDAVYPPPARPADPVYWDQLTAVLAYLILCPHCGDTAPPAVDTGDDQPDTTDLAGGLPLQLAGRTRMSHRCSRCGGPLPPPVYRPELHLDDDGAIRFTLSSDHARVTWRGPMATYNHRLLTRAARAVWEHLAGRLDIYEPVTARRTGPGR